MTVTLDQKNESVAKMSRDMINALSDWLDTSLNGQTVLKAIGTHNALVFLAGSLEAHLRSAAPSIGQDRLSIDDIYTLYTEGYNWVVNNPEIKPQAQGAGP